FLSTADAGEERFLLNRESVTFLVHFHNTHIDKPFLRKVDFLGNETQVLLGYFRKDGNSFANPTIGGSSASQQVLFLGVCRLDLVGWRVLGFVFAKQHGLGAVVPKSDLDRPFVAHDYFREIQVGVVADGCENKFLAFWVLENDRNIVEDISSIFPII